MCRHQVNDVHRRAVKRYVRVVRSCVCVEELDETSERACHDETKIRCRTGIGRTKESRQKPSHSTNDAAVNLKTSVHFSPLTSLDPRFLDERLPPDLLELMVAVCLDVTLFWPRNKKVVYVESDDE